MLIIREIIQFEPEHTGTSIDVALDFLNRAIKKRTTTFILSDFIDSHNYLQSMQIAANKHDLIALQVYDDRDSKLPDVGLIRAKDIETGKMMWIDTSRKSIRRLYEAEWYKQQQLLRERTLRSGVDMASVSTNEDYVRILLQLFKSRMSR